MDAPERQGGSVAHHVQIDVADFAQVPGDVGKILRHRLHDLPSAGMHERT